MINENRKFLNKIWNEFKSIGKKIIHCDQVGLIPGMRVNIQQVQIYEYDIIPFENEWQKPYDHFNNWRKKLHKIQIPFLKNSHKS